MPPVVGNPTLRTVPKCIQECDLDYVSHIHAGEFATQARRYKSWVSTHAREECVILNAFREFVNTGLCVTQPGRVCTTLSRLFQLCIYVRSFFHQWHYSPLLGPGLFFSFVTFFTQTVGLLGRVIIPSQGRYLHTGQHKHRINAHTDIDAFEWDSDQRS
jgi:hypothetical protein